MSALQEALFDILESEAIDKYYLYKHDIKGFANSPAFIICTGYFAKAGCITVEAKEKTGEKNDAW